MKQRTIPMTHWIWRPIWDEKLHEQPVLVYFRKECEFLRIPASYKIWISADTRYKLYINGVFVELGPARGDNHAWYRDEIDIASYLKEGGNVLAVEVLRYPVAHTDGNFSMFRTCTPGLFFETHNDMDESENIYADESWRCRMSEGCKFVREREGFAPLMFMEERTGEMSNAGWKLPGFNDSNWEYAYAYNAREMKNSSTPGNLSERPIPYMRKDPCNFAGVVPKNTSQEIFTWEPFLQGAGTVTLHAGIKQTIEIDAGELTCGYISLRVKNGAGSKIRLLCSEGYVRNGTYPGSASPIKDNRLDWENGYLSGYTDIYNVSGYGSDNLLEIFEPFWFRTFRFIRLEIETGEELVIEGFDYLETGYPLAVSTTAEASDDRFPAIWDISLRTLKRCMHETYIDCPFYEQLQYIMDARVEILYTYMISADDRLARQCMDDFRRSQRADGLLNACYPTVAANVIPMFSVYYILMVYDHMMFFGDEELVRTHLGTIDNILNFFEQHLDDRGMLESIGGRNGSRYWSFIDWAIPWRDTTGMPLAGMGGRPLTMESLLYIYGLMHAAKLCEYVGRNDTAREYNKRAEKVRCAVNVCCRDEEGVYLDGPGIKEYSQHCQVFALLTDTVAATQGRKLILKSLEDENKFAQCTVAMTFYLCRAMEKAGIYDKTKDIWNIWQEMLQNNLTTCVENNLDQRSDCHAWGALILYELPAAILGVRPGAPGYEKILISPVPGYLNHAKGSVATKWGMVDVEWFRRRDGSLDLRYNVPEGVKDRVVVNAATLN